MDIKEDLKSFFEAHESGLYTQKELISKIFLFPAEVEIERFIALIPDSITKELKQTEIVQNPPKSIEDVFMIKYGSEDEKQRVLLSARRWNEYFYG